MYYHLVPKKRSYTKSLKEGKRILAIFPVMNIRYGTFIPSEVGQNTRMKMPHIEDIRETIRAETNFAIGNTSPSSHGMRFIPVAAKGEYDHSFRCEKKVGV